MNEDDSIFGDGDREKLARKPLVPGDIRLDSQSFQVESAPKSWFSSLIGTVVERFSSLNNEPFKLTVEEYRNILKESIEGADSCEPPAMLFMPRCIIDVSEMDKLERELEPCFVPPIFKGEDLSFFKETAPNVWIHQICGIVFFKLQNGITVQCKQTNFEKNVCSIKILMRGGRSITNRQNNVFKIPEAEGLQIGLESIMDGGFNGYHQKGIAKLLRLWGLYVEMTVDLEHSSIIIQLDSTESSNIAKAFELIHAGVMKSNWDDESFERSLRLAVLTREHMETQLEEKTSCEVTRLIAPGDPRFDVPSPSNLGLIVLTEARSLVEAQLHPALMEVSIVGDFNINTIQPLLKRWLGTINMKSPPTQFKPFDVEFCHNKIVSEAWVEDNSSRSIVIISWPFCGKYGSSTSPSEADYKKHKSFRFRCWKLLEIIITDRLHKELREAKGLVYGVQFSCLMMEYADMGTANVSLDPPPQKALEAWNECFHVLQEICTTRPPTDAEFQEAKTPWLKNLESMERTNQFWLAQVGQLQIPESVRTISHAIDVRIFYEKLRLEDLNEALAANFKPNPSVTVFGMSGGWQERKLLRNAVTEARSTLTKMFPNNNRDWPQRPWEMSHSYLKKILNKIPWWFSCSVGVVLLCSIAILLPLNRRNLLKIAK
eukprot:GHVL01031011.1.p1 GENE.GHVL01031011.1~~GHVL01031011.1.p1  ORF type:complete len:658 (+),score=97.28 GHVL01031011.1:1645-3618(+)